MTFNHVFKPVNRKITKEIYDPKTKTRKSTVVSTVVYKEGPEGTGVTLGFPCGFCKDPKTGLATHAFRTRRERNKHASDCPDRG